MARERYLIKVDPQDLAYRPAPQEPMTPRKRLENFWYHYKWLVIGCAVLLTTLAILIVQSATRVQPDYFVCLVSDQPVTSQMENLLQQALEKCAEDRNGDGTVRVEVECYNISPGDEQSTNPAAVTNQQSVMAHLMARDVSLWALAPSYYNGTLASALEGNPSSFFMPLDALSGSVEGLSDNSAYWNWKGAPIQEQPGMETAPEELYWGVRVISENASDDEKQEVSSALELLLRFAKQQKPAF